MPTIMDKKEITIPLGGKLCKNNVKVELDKTSYYNLVANNIRKGVTILGIEGSLEYEGSFTGTKILIEEDKMYIISDSITIKNGMLKLTL